MSPLLEKLQQKSITGIRECQEDARTRQDYGTSFTILKHSWPSSTFLNHHQPSLLFIIVRAQAWLTIVDLVHGYEPSVSHEPTILIIVHLYQPSAAAAQDLAASDFATFTCKLHCRWTWAEHVRQFAQVEKSNTSWLMLDDKPREELPSNQPIRVIHGSEACWLLVG